MSGGAYYRTFAFLFFSRVPDQGGRGGVAGGAMSIAEWVHMVDQSTARRTKIATRGIGSSRRGRRCRGARARARARTRYPRASVGEPPFGPRGEDDASEGGTRAHPGDAQSLLFQRVLPVGRRGKGRRGRGRRRRRGQRGCTVCGMLLMHGARGREIQAA
jgi:hypothetical protein